MAVDLDFGAVMDRLELHAMASGKAIPNKITDVRIGAPTPSGSRCGRLFYGGEADPTERMGGNRVLDGQLVAERVVMIFFWQLTGQKDDYVTTVLNEVRALKHELKTRILADSQLNTNPQDDGICDLSLSFADVEFSLIGPAGFVVLTIECLAYFQEYEVVP